jgi:putative membrane protein
MFYSNYFWGMHFYWWCIWVILLVWIFAIPYNIPGQRYKRESSLDILQRRFASGEITTQEYQEKKKILEDDLTKQNQSRYK